MCGNRDEHSRLTSIDGIKEIRALLVLLDIGVNEKGVRLRVNILHHNLEPIEAASFRYLDFSAEAFHQVFVHNAIRGGEEGKHMGDEVTLIVIQSMVPIVQILGQIDLLGGPEGCFGLFIHLPNLQKHHKAISCQSITERKPRHKSTDVGRRGIHKRPRTS